MGTDCHFAIEVNINGSWFAVIFSNDYMEMPEFLENQEYKIVKKEYIACGLFEDTSESETSHDEDMNQIYWDNIESFLLMKELFGDPACWIGLFYLRLKERYHIEDLFIHSKRNYDAFSKIAGVRNRRRDIKLYRGNNYFKPRGFPKDISEAIKRHTIYHTPTHFYHYEVENVPELNLLFGHKINLIKQEYPEYRILIYFDS